MSFDDRVEGGREPEAPGRPHVAGRSGRDAGHSVERVDGGGSPKRRDGPGVRRVATGVGLRRPPVGLVLGWGDVAERGVQPLVVEPADPRDDRQFGLLVGAPDENDDLRWPHRDGADSSGRCNTIAPGPVQAIVFSRRKHLRADTVISCTYQRKQQAPIPPIGEAALSS
jgi:hypothetical protein